MTYLVSTKPDGARWWWCPGYTPPHDHTDIRAATPDEAAEIDAILRCAAVLDDRGMLAANKRLYALDTFKPARLP